MSDQSVPTPETQNAAAEPADQGSMEAAALAFETRNTQTETLPEEPPATETEPDDSDAEPAEGEPADDTEQPELVEVEFEGAKFSIPADKAEEFQKATLRQADYSRRMNEVSAKEKAYTHRLELIESIEQTADKRAEAIAEIKLIDSQIKAYEGVNWAQAEADNPAEAAMAAVKLMQLQQRRSQAEAKTASIGREIEEGRQKLLAERAADMAKVLDKEIPDWRGEAGARITAYAQEKGYTSAQIAEKSVNDPLWVVAMEKARKFDAIQAGKAAVKLKAQSAPPVLKPGAPRKTETSDALARLRKSGTQEDAEAAFLQRMR